MAIDFKELSYLHNPDQQTLKADYHQLLLSLSGPTIIDITCNDSKDWGVVTTLLHGNEPSGLIALHQLLTADLKNHQPKLNLRFIICSVEAASTVPLFTHRFLPGGKDLNRCFSKAKDKNYYGRAALIKQAIKEVNPLWLVDLHNTSGSSPAFAVAAKNSIENQALASLFTDTIILSHIRIGALLEQEFNCPTVTIECGGSNELQSHKVAIDGLKRLTKYTADVTIEVPQIKLIQHPMRLEVKNGAELSYAREDEGKRGVTLINTIEQMNHGICRPGQILGWVNCNTLNNLSLLDEQQANVVNEYLAIEENHLVARCYFKVFMATANKNIALSDCLFYIAPLPPSEASKVFA